MIIREDIDGGKGFDWSRASLDYAKYRDIYPPGFYQYLSDHHIGEQGQSILDIGTGTGVLPRNLYPYGATFIGVDNSEGQIRQANVLAQQSNMELTFLCVPAEEIAFPPKSFDVVTACQCFTYFQHEILAKKLSQVLKPSGRFVILYMAWLPYEDEIAGQSESLVLTFNPSWTGCRETRHVISVPEAYLPYFEVESQDLFDVAVPFNREAWHGRMKSCRGIGASLPDTEITRFDQAHRQLLQKIAPENFHILHYVAATILKKK